MTRGLPSMSEMYRRFRDLAPANPSLPVELSKDEYIELLEVVIAERLHGCNNDDDGSPRTVNHTFFGREIIVDGVIRPARSGEVLPNA